MWMSDRSTSRIGAARPSISSLVKPKRGSAVAFRYIQTSRRSAASNIVSVQRFQCEGR